MAIRDLIILMAIVFSVSLLAQEMTQEEKVTAVKEFCQGLDINGKVLSADRADAIKKVCQEKANSNNIMCRWYSINGDSSVTIVEDKFEDVRIVCKQLVAKVGPDRTEKQETSFWSYFGSVPHGR